ALLRRRHNIDFPVSRGPWMPTIESLRRHHEPLGIGGILGHPVLACRRIPGGCRVAYADEAELLGLLERGQARRPSFARRERRGMIGAVEGERLADVHIAGNHGPTSAKARAPGLSQFPR